MFLGEDELGVAEQEPLGGPVAQYLGRSAPGGGIPRLVRAQQMLGLLAVVLQVRMGRQLGMTIRHHNLFRRRGPLARPERGWSCPVHLTLPLEVGKSLPADWQRPRTLHSH